MPDRLDSALRRFELIRARSDDVGAPLRLGRELSHWAQEEVCAVVEEAVRRPDFRRLARWSLDHLTPNAKTEARQLVEAVDHALVEGAAQLAALTRKPPLSLALTEALQNGEAPSRRSRDRAPSAPRSTPPTVADFVAGRPWRDLVSIYDYFGYVGELNLADRSAWLGPDSQQAQLAEFTPFINPTLKLPGDLIARSLFIRIEYWQSHLQKFMVHCDNLLARRSPRMTKARTALRSALQGISPAVQRLENVCRHAADVRLREATVKLLQMFAAYRPRADFTWLNPGDYAPEQAGIWRYHLEHRADLDIADDVAAALREIAPLFRSELDPDLVIEEKVRQLPLVVIDGLGRREVYWKNSLCDVDWDRHKRAFTLLRTLVEKGKRGLGVDAADDLGISLKDAKGDLTKFLPEPLSSLIQVRQATYKLNLPADKMYLGSFGQEDRLEEVK